MSRPKEGGSPLNRPSGPRLRPAAGGIGARTNPRRRLRLEPLRAESPRGPSEQSAGYAYRSCLVSRPKRGGSPLNRPSGRRPAARSRWKIGGARTNPRRRLRLSRCRLKAAGRPAVRRFMSFMSCDEPKEGGSPRCDPRSAGLRPAADRRRANEPSGVDSGSSRAAGWPAVRPSSPPVHVVHVL